MGTAFADADVDGAESHTTYVFDSLELRRTSYGPQADGTVDYGRDEAVYLIANGMRLARLAYSAPAGVPKVKDGLHVLLQLQDHLGSTAIVMDRATSELVEAGTYSAYGSAESDYRPGR